VLYLGNVAEIGIFNSTLSYTGLAIHGFQGSVTMTLGGRHANSK
jgi:hypothetical protein